MLLLIIQQKMLILWTVDRHHVNEQAVGTESDDRIILVELVRMCLTSASYSFTSQQHQFCLGINSIQIEKIIIVGVEKLAQFVLCYYL